MSKTAPIHLDREMDTPLYLQLAWQLKSLIKEGVFRPEEKLPPIRVLASQMKVNSITVVNAYKQLEKEGLAYSRMGSGTYVSPSDVDEPVTYTYMETDDLRMMERGQISLRGDTINFASTTPASDLFPVRDFKGLINKVLDRDKGEVFAYHQVQGFQPLRQSICKYLEKYSVYTTVDSIQVVSGAQQGIDIISKALIEFGDYIFVESPTYRGAIEAFKSRGARIIGITMEEDGMNLEELEHKISVYNPKFIYTMPNFQNPTGYSYSTEKKKGLLEIAANRNTYIVEDDFLSELSYREKPSLPLKACKHSENVVYIKSFSKIFMPGLRLGFMHVPEPLWNRVLSAKHTTDISTSGLIQRTFDLYLREGLWMRHIEDMGKRYKERYELFMEMLKIRIPRRIHYKDPCGGLHVWFQLPENYSDEKLYAKCLKRGVLITPGSLFFAGNSSGNHYRMSFASVNSADITKGLKIMGEVLDKYLNEERTTSIPSKDYSPFM